MNEPSVKRSYSRLVALRDNLPRGIAVDQKYVVEFHSILDTLEKELGQNFDVHRVPGTELRRRTTNKKMLTGEVSYSNSPECDRAFLLMKIVAVLNLFKIQAERKTIGFNAR